MITFDFRNRNDKNKHDRQDNMPDDFVSEDEQKYYQPKEYYTNKAFEGTPFEKEVITFEDRKKTSYPSARGLYVAEILLLEYCSYGTYPHPRNGYPGFWWFEYGIKDVGSALKTLEDRGFIRFATPEESVPPLKVSELKQILKEAGLSTAGKKEDLVKRVQENISDSVLSSVITENKYVLTDVGKEELKENEYVPYMHKSKEKTTDDDTFGPVFNVWEVNRRLYNRPVSEWRSVVEEIKAEQAEYHAQKENEHKKYIEELETSDPQFAEELKSMDRKLEESDQEVKRENEARQKYEETGDINAYIEFWEKEWINGGPKTRGSTRMFTLPDLYIKQKRYDDALKILQYIEDTQHEEKDKAISYIDRVNKLKNKQSK